MEIYSRVLCAVALIAKREFGSTIWNTCFTSKYEKKKCIIFMRVKTITKFQPNEWNRSFIITVNLGGSIFLPTSIRLCELSRTDNLYRNTIRSNKRIDHYQIWLHYTKHDRRHKNIKKKSQAYSNWCAIFFYIYQSRLSLPLGSSRNLLNARDSACLKNYYNHWGVKFTKTYTLHKKRFNSL